MPVGMASVARLAAGWRLDVLVLAIGVVEVVGVVEGCVCMRLVQVCTLTITRQGRHVAWHALLTPFGARRAVTPSPPP